MGKRGGKSPVSAGLLAYRRRGGIEVLLAHPGGPFWAGRDVGVWSIPKGLVEPGDDLLATAKREFTEETNLTPGQEFIPLAPVRQAAGKLVYTFAFAADFDLSVFASNKFEIEWPPKSGQRKNFPEVDRITYFSLVDAAMKILPYQRPLLDELALRLG